MTLQVSRSPWDLFRPPGSGAVTAAGASPGFIRRVIFYLSLHPTAMPGKRASNHISWALLALQSLLLGVTLSQEAGPGEGQLCVHCFTKQDPVTDWDRALCAFPNH